jgi:hypothetical protein
VTNNPARNFLITIILLIGVLAGITWVNYRFSVQNPGGNDFLARWVGANKWLLEGLSPYDDRVSLETQELIYGHPADPEAGEDKNHFIYPMYSMVFFGPFGLLDYTIARAIWMTILEVAAVALVWISLRVANWRTSFWMTAFLVLFSLIWYHGARTIILGQFAVINAFMIALAIYLIRNEQDFSAGVLLALSTIKPQMVYLLVPFVFIWAYSVRRFRILSGFLVTFAILMVVTLALVPNWPMAMIAQMLDYPTYTTTISPLAVIAGRSPGIQPLFGQVLHAIAYIYVLAQWLFSYGKDERWFEWTALMTLVITHLVAYRTATTNYLVLLPALFLVFRVTEQRWQGVGRVMTLAVLLALGAGLWGLFIVTVTGNIEGPIMYLPVPFLCLFGLWWVRWWALRPPRLMLEEFSRRLG